ncbi:MATH and LRR domain-containing protein PFE0570w-like [Ctenocephalides felis]|uniref:MATH and LRR domain-containing protein PFE0570w-like n=1 Tax=Ctenocephalides felis TaxID=7515 RepID=UPI000E6E3E79|nr:MATH and LRR domain-containing protein PFE0570w-like [Ctenocephalides felis]
MQLPQLDNNEIKKQTITRSFEECSKTVSNKDNSLSSRNVFDDLSKKEQSSSTFSHENKMTKKPVENYERLSDKYPRKRISDSGNAEYMQKHTSSHLLPSNKSAVKNADFEQKKILSSKLDPNPFGKIIHSTEENSKLINIPDIKPNDPRIKTVSSPRSEPLPLVTNYDMPNTKNSTFSESRSRYTFPSILDMDYRYVPNQNFVHSQAVQPQTFTTNPKSNFMPRHNNQNFHQKTPLLPTPNSNIRNSKDFTNSEKCYVSASHEYQNTDYFYDNADQRISKNDYYDHQFDYRDRVQFDLNEHSSLKYNKHEFMHSNSRFHDNSRSHYRGNSAYGRDNKYRWSRSLSKMSDPRTFRTDDSNCHVENDIDYRSPRENTSSALNLNKSSSFLEESITQNSSKVTDVKRPSPKENINNQLKDIAKTPHDVKSTIMNNDKVDIKSQSVISDCNNVKNINTKDENKQSDTEDQLNILQKLEEKIGSKKVEKIKQIIDGDSDEDINDNKSNISESPIFKKKKKRIKKIESDSSDEDVTDSNKHTNYECNENSNEVQDIEKKVVKPKRRNALEMLQHDVRDMFICEGVLTATGRRMCRILKEDSIMETNCILNTDDLKSNSCRKNRKNLRKINYTESKDDLTLNTEEENETFKSKSSMHMQPRIILEKLKDFDCQLEIEENICRGRNVARRGRGISISARTLRNPIRNEKINTNLNKCDAENQNVIEKNGQCEDIASENTEDKNDAVDKEHNSIPEKCDNLMSDSGEKNIVKCILNESNENSIVNRSENKSTDNVNEDVDFNDYKKIDDGPPLIVHDLVSNHEYGLKNDSNKKPSDNTAEIVSSESEIFLLIKILFCLKRGRTLKNEDNEVLPQNDNAQIILDNITSDNTETSQKIISGSNLDFDKNITTETKDITSDIQPEISDKVRAINLDFLSPNR